MTLRLIIFHFPFSKVTKIYSFFLKNKEHNMIVVDATPTSETGLFVLKFIPKKSGTHLAMIRFNGENLQHKWLITYNLI